MEKITFEFPLSHGGVEPLCAWKISSGVTGPLFIALAAQHGNEINGSAAIREFVKKYDGKLKKGSFIGIPFANFFALRLRKASSDLGEGQPYIESARNMQTLWSGSGGNEIARLAQFWWDNLLKQADYIVDLHCYPKFYSPMAAVRPEPEPERLAAAAGLPFIRRIKREDDWKGSLRYKAESEGIVTIGVELSGQYDLDDNEIDRGLRVVENLAGAIGLLDAIPRPPEQAPVEIRGRVDVGAPAAGLFIHRRGLVLGTRVEKGEYLGCLLKTEDLEEIPVTAPVSGVISVLGGRADCDVTLAACHRYTYLDERILSIVPC